MMNMRLWPLIILLASLIIFTVQAKTIDPYKVLGVERNASQREIQKAFHKLSLQYHPDKNKNKGAQEKFSEINNAYDILSDEEKRKNYDLYGDEKGSSGFDAGSSRNHEGYTYFTSGGPGNSRFTFRPDEWQNMGGQGQSRPFSFSFGNPSGQNSFNFGLNDIFSNFFGGDSNGGNYFSGFGGSSRPQSGSKGSLKRFTAVNAKVFKKDISDQGITWLLLSYTPTLKGYQYYESAVQEVSDSLQGALKVGSINCEEQSFCKEQGIYPRRVPRVFLYSYRTSNSGSLVEYTDDLVVKNLKTFCLDHLPRFSKRVDLTGFEFPSDTVGGLPRVMLLSTKKDTPVIWRVLSGLYRRRFVFYDASVHDVSDPMVKNLGVDALPAVVGWLSNGEKHILKVGISVKDLESAVHDLSVLLDGFERKSKNAASSWAKKTYTEATDKRIPLLTGSNFNVLCGEKTPVCIIGVFRSSRAREKLESILLTVSKKSLSRLQNSASGSRDSISYMLLDASKQQAFLNAFDNTGFKSLDKLLVAYKPRKGKFAAFVSEASSEELEGFISSVLNGDVQFKKTLKTPLLK